MGQPEQPSYTELVYRVLRAAEEPLPFDEIVAAVERLRPITTRDSKATIRGASPGAAGTECQAAEPA